MATYINETFAAQTGWTTHIYATQFIQAEALGSAYRGWRRRWGGPGHYAVAGALVWQLNDCWPVTSWAILDYALRPKPAYYVTRRELAPWRWAWRAQPTWPAARPSGPSMARQRCWRPNWS